MRKTREAFEADEREVLADYAQRVSESAGRIHGEPLHPNRTAYQRDRARIIHSRAFRRLEYKTQVFLNGEGDHLRTRLTHTIEVASVSRSIACALGLNEDLAEVIDLAHDLGHAPVGHAGEEKLDELMRGHGGFEHNEQSLRVVETIESRYPEFDGLNLSYEVLEGLRKHERGYEREGERFSCASLEAQVANLADEITYYSHDLDDGLDHDLITVEQLEEIDIWRECRARVEQDFPKLGGKRLVGYVIRLLTDLEVEDVAAATHARIEAAGVRTADDVRRCDRPLAGYSDRRRKQNAELRKFLYRNLYYHPEVAGPNQRGCGMIEGVFGHYFMNPDKLGGRTSERLERDGLERTVCDYVSGMTDRFLMEEAARLE
ncbi:MAG: deoxyguanosinetriphosphate triphosphohydrolase [Verrucomicrobiales bacterium]|nr:deoxyguanosinetriphosphate triphosphohydrolase [Verrucomicrobiales bacterium]